MNTLVKKNKVYHLFKLFAVTLFCKQFFILQLKSKHVYYNNDNIWLLMASESGSLNLSNSHVTKKVDEAITISVEQYSKKTVVKFAWR